MGRTNVDKRGQTWTNMDKRGHRFDKLKLSAINLGERTKKGFEPDPKREGVGATKRAESSTCGSDGCAEHADERPEKRRGGTRSRSGLRLGSASLFHFSIVDFGFSIQRQRMASDLRIASRRSDILSDESWQWVCAAG